MIPDLESVQYLLGFYPAFSIFDRVETICGVGTIKGYDTLKDKYFVEIEITRALIILEEGQMSEIE